MKNYDRQDDADMMQDPLASEEHHSNPVFIAGRSGLGVFGEEEPDVNLLGDGTRHRRLREGTLLLVVVLLIASGILVGMRWMGTRGVKVDQDVTVETKVDAFLKAYEESTRAANEAEAGGSQAQIMVNNLTDDRTTSQVPLEGIRFNPFVLHMPGRLTEPANGDDQNSESRRLQQQREAERRLMLQYQAEVNRMTLGSILGRPGRFVAQLDDNIVQVGDSIHEGRFVVTAITATSLTLQADQFQYTLHLNE